MLRKQGNANLLVSAASGDAEAELERLRHALAAAEEALRQKGARDAALGETKKMLTRSPTW